MFVAITMIDGSVKHIYLTVCVIERSSLLSSESMKLFLSLASCTLSHMQF